MGRVPELRFPEFSGEWEKDKIGNIAKINPSSKTLPQNFIYIDLESVDDGILHKKPAIDKNSAPSRAQRVLQPDDILFQTVRPYQKNNYYFTLNDDDYVASTGYAQIRTDKNSPKFLYQLLHTERFVYDVLVRCTGTSYPAINSSELKKIQIAIPSFPEQQKIADFLTAVDEKITLTTDKISQLETYKHGMMQKLLSGELRFPGFSGEWREVKLGEIATFSKGKGISKNDIDKNGAIKCIRYGELYTEYDETIDNVKSRTNIDPSDLVLSKKNDIIIPASGETPIDIATASCVTEDGIALGGDLNIVRTTENGIFLAYYLNSIKKIDIAKLSQGISVVHLYSSQLKTLGLKLPAIEEQNKIAHSISTIVNKLTLEKEKLDRLKRYKQGLLQKMFV